MMLQFDFNLLEFLNGLPWDRISETSWRYITALFLLAALILVSRWQGLGIGNKLVVGTIRGTIQILIMALFLVSIFALENLIIIFIVLTFMGVFAAHTVRSNLDHIPGAMSASLPGILIAGLSVMFISVLLGIIPVIGEYIIPMGGMVIGNSMTMSSLVIDRMWSNAQKQRSLIETALSLGANPTQANELTIREAIRAGLLPNLNRYASLGIVSIPGLMSGMIIGGEHPIVAAFYQVIVFIMIFLAATICGFIISRMFLRKMFNERYQLLVPPLQK